MTEKKQRFENRLDKNNIKFNTINPVWDNWQETALNVFEMIDLLNEQSDELVEYCNFSLHDLLDKKNKEIEQLKAQLKKGEDVCSICKHQYMTKRDTDEYYIAKCKKEHIKCSKGTVNYCEDFECNEVIE